MKTRGFITVLLMGGMVLAGGYSPAVGSLTTENTLSIVAKACPDTGYVSVKSCNLRSTPDKTISSNIITTLKKGDTFTVLDFDGYWYYVESTKGTGYVSHKMVTLDGYYSTTCDDLYTDGYVTAANACNLRSTPDKTISNNIIATLKKGETFTVLSYDGYWYYVECAKGTGYVSHKMVNVYGSYPVSSSSNISNSGTCATSGRVTASSACNLRSTPDKTISSNIIATLKKGDTFTVLDYNGYWYYVKTSKGTGYVSHKMVEVW